MTSLEQKTTGLYGNSQHQRRSDLEFGMFGEPLSLKFSPSGCDGLVLENSLHPVQEMLGVPTVQPVAILSSELRQDEHDDYEPFGITIEDQPPDGFHRFINSYRGPYYQSLLLNRPTVERFLRLGRMRTVINLTSMTYNRARYIPEIGSDGTAVLKRGLTLNFGRSSGGEENPYYNVISTPVGWTIEINSQRMVDEVTEESTDKFDVERFAEEFNSTLRQALISCLIDEKLSSVKDQDFRDKAVWSILAFTLAMNSFCILHRPMPPYLVV